MEKFLIGPDYMVYRLTGVYGTDPEASEENETAKE